MHSTKTWGLEQAVYGGVMGAGTNCMNICVVAKASQGLANYLGIGGSVVIGYDSRHI